MVRKFILLIIVMIFISCGSSSPSRDANSNVPVPDVTDEKDDLTCKEDSECKYVVYDDYCQTECSEYQYDFSDEAVVAVNVDWVPRCPENTVYPVCSSPITLNEGDTVVCENQVCTKKYGQ